MSYGAIISLTLSLSRLNSLVVGEYSTTDTYKDMYDVHRTIYVVPIYMYVVHCKKNNFVYMCSYLNLSDKIIHKFKNINSRIFILLLYTQCYNSLLYLHNLINENLYDKGHLSHITIYYNISNTLLYVEVLSIMSSSTLPITFTNTTITHTSPLPHQPR